MPKGTFGDRRDSRPSKLRPWFECDVLKAECIVRLIVAHDEEQPSGGLPIHLQKLKITPSPRRRLH